ncbi:Gfo/Idh/MocA family protein [Fulvivirga ligni]|uniref:Gfo/Idh/MocA family protein n=1 Tax=Fulvivirga ligni TaxID=2904246 RepID=UPI001F249E83|nr:Gfo/Idh/MocA family oxidoreductase [Fulvivirga ligni]UII24314.1 Gfo/Idh/MocA family oxidoreductase [Fulvivirga ligni]
MNINQRKVRMGMVGGSKDAFIGAVHRNAAALDQEIELVCGAFSSNPEKSKETGQSLYLPEERIYATWEEMITKESKLPEGERMDFVAIVTPNHLHFGPAKKALENGFHVMVDKPLCFTVEEAEELNELVEKTGLVFGLTHTYSGYPMIKEAREYVASGKLGKVRKIYVEYPQGWLSQPLEASDNKQASWRTDPGRSGKSGCIGDIGTHAAHLAEYVSGLPITSLSAQLNIVVPNRRLDDDGAILLKFGGDVTGVLMATQIAAGEENNLKVRVYGEKGGVEWNHADANTLWVKWLDKPAEKLRTGNDYLSKAAKANTRVPAGHPEGYLEAFANIYRNFAMAVRAQVSGNSFDDHTYDFPGVEDGLMGMKFIDRAVESSNEGGKWLEV